MTSRAAADRQIKDDRQAVPQISSARPRGSRYLNYSTNHVTCRRAHQAPSALRPLSVTVVRATSIVLPPALTLSPFATASPTWKRLAMEMAPGRSRQERQWLCQLIHLCYLERSNLKQLRR